MFTVYSMPNCPHCVGAKELLKARGYEFKEKTAGEDFTKDQLEAILGKPVRTLPQIVFEANGVKRHIGGFTDLQARLKAPESLTE